MFSLFIKWLVAIFKIEEKAPPIVIHQEEPELPIPLPASTTEDNFVYIKKDKAHGIDLSHHNKGVSIKDLEQDFVFIKVTEGVSFVSPSFESMARSLNISKIPWGSYHYYRPELDPIRQAKHFTEKALGNLPCVLDIEQEYGDRKALVSDLRIFLEYVENFTGKTPIIYSGYSYLVDLSLPVDFEKYPLWLAWYTEEEKVSAPSPWKDWTFWQYSENAKIKGVFGKCDANLFKRNK